MFPEADDRAIESIVERISTRNFYYSHGSFIDYKEAQKLSLKASFRAK